MGADCQDISEDHRGMAAAVGGDGPPALTVAPIFRFSLSWKTEWINDLRLTDSPVVILWAVSLY
jgi:hypothetical protein